MLLGNSYGEEITRNLNVPNSVNNIWLIQGMSGSGKSTFCKNIIKSGSYEHVKISGGDILRISADGELEYAKFNYTDYSGLGYCNWWNYGTGYGADKEYNNIYIEDLKSIAAYQGILPEDIDFMLSQGFTVDEIEEYLYCCE